MSNLKNDAIELEQNLVRANWIKGAGIVRHLILQNSDKKIELELERNENYRLRQDHNILSIASLLLVFLQVAMVITYFLWG